MTGKHHSEFFCGVIKGFQLSNIPAAKAAKIMNISESSAYHLYTRLKAVKLEDVIYKTSEPASVHTKSEPFDDREVRGIVRDVKKNPSITLSEIATQSVPGRQVCLCSIRKVLRQNQFKTGFPTAKTNSRKSHRRKRKS